MHIMIFDIDGTLTHSQPAEIKTESGYHTFAYWPLLSEYFAQDALRLREAATRWDASDKGTDDDFIKSSHQMLQEGIAMFKPGVTSESMRAQAKKITTDFIKQGIIREGALEFLLTCLKQGDLCILSTGSYEDGAQGFVDALKACAPTSAWGRVLVSGAQIDWPSRKVIHANIAKNKQVGLLEVLKKQIPPITLETSNITGIFVDDPFGNDSGLCELCPSKVFVMQTHRELDLERLRESGYRLFRHWQALNAQNSALTLTG